jgi:HlyD family secretion protein
VREEGPARAALRGDNELLYLVNCLVMTTRRRPPLRTLVLVPMLLAVAACGSESAAPAKAAPPGGPPPGPPPVAVKVAAVVERPAVEQVAFVATVEASVATTAGAELAGHVVEMAVTEGDRVVAGRTVLARLDTGPREIELREAMAAVAKAREELEKLRRGSRAEEIAQREADVAAQQAILDRAEADFRRGEQLHERELISRAELQRWESDFLAAKHRHRQLAEAFRMTREGPRPEEIGQAEAELGRSQARADRIRDEIQRSTIRAPISGFVVRKRMDVGAWLQPGTPLVDLIVLDPVFVTGPVGEREIPRVQVGQPATIIVDAYPGRVFEGVVTAVIPGADPTSRTFPVRVTVRNPESLLKAGMFARAAVRTGAERRALFVPRDALVRRGREEHVLLVDGARATAVRVETGRESDGLVEVRAGDLRAGQPVVTLGAELVQPGASVQVIE